MSSLKTEDFFFLEKGNPLQGLYSNAQKSSCTLLQFVKDLEPFSER